MTINSKKLEKLAEFESILDSTRRMRKNCADAAGIIVYNEIIEQGENEMTAIGAGSHVSREVWKIFMKLVEITKKERDALRRSCEEDCN